MGRTIGDDRNGCFAQQSDKSKLTIQKNLKQLELLTAFRMQILLGLEKKSAPRGAGDRRRRWWGDHIVNGKESKTFAESERDA